MYRVVVHRRAARYLQRQPRDQQDRLKKALRQLGEDPASVSDTRPMHGEWQGYQRLRVGELRVIYLVDPEKQTVFVDHIGSRGVVYK